jgi:hypothetical protein
MKPVSISENSLLEAELTGRRLSDAIRARFSCSENHPVAIFAGRYVFNAAINSCGNCFGFSFSPVQT